MARCVAGLGELHASATRGDELLVYGLGSCVGIVAHDVQGGAWALGHVVLPGPEPVDTPRGKPAYYADTGVTAVLGSLQRLLHRAPLVEVALFGGATAVDGLNAFDIGRRNVLAVRRALWQRGLVPTVEDVGGTASRTLHIVVGDRHVSLRTADGVRDTIHLSPARP